MSGATLLEDLTRRGVKLWTEGGELRCRGPKKTLTPEVLAQLKQHKPEILEQLNTPTAEARRRQGARPDLGLQADVSPKLETDVRCIHGTTSDKCAVCNGYARWLIADEGRLRRAQVNPEVVRREFWQSVRGGAA